jgi:hypothetical protein
VITKNASDAGTDPTWNQALELIGNTSELKLYFNETVSFNTTALHTKV